MDYDKEVVRKWGKAMASCRTVLCLCQDLTLKTQLEAVNGKKMLALEVFAHALRFFKEHALQVCCSSQCPDWGRDTLALPSSSLLPLHVQMMNGQGQARNRLQGSLSCLLELRCGPARLLTPTTDLPKLGSPHGCSIVHPAPRET